MANHRKEAITKDFLCDGCFQHVEKVTPMEFEAARYDPLIVDGCIREVSAIYSPYTRQLCDACKKKVTPARVRSFSTEYPKGDQS